jgi:ribosomal protein S18 acetylase RimI-like enzyme
MNNLFSNSPISIATPDDTHQLVNLVNSAYRGDGAKKGWTTEADLLDGIRTDEKGIQKQFETADAVILKFTEEDNQIIGCVYLHKQSSKLYLGMLTVTPGLQAKGIGKKLLAASEAYGIQEGCVAVTMTVISVRQELIAWYERHGYSATGETRPFPNSPEFGLPRQELNFIVMEKKLEAAQ